MIDKEKGQLFEFHRREGAYNTFTVLHTPCFSIIKSLSFYINHGHSNMLLSKRYHIMLEILFFEYFRPFSEVALFICTVCKL